MSQAFEIESAGGVVTVRLAGPEATYEQMLEVNAELADKLRYEGAKRFIFDLTAVELFASACIGALVELLREVEPSRGRIVLAGCTPNVQYLFRITKLEDIFCQYDDLEDAQAAMAA